ncbi:MAG: DNA alkylation repair protein, partial [Bacteroidota bacterium]
MNKEILNRKGARKVQDVPEEVLKYLNEGALETVNLTEWLAIDHAKLVKAVFPKFGVEEQTIAQISKAILSQKKPSAMSTTKLVGGTLLYQQ